MNNSLNKPKLLFLFSLPRSGSTLCQRIMGAHKDIATAAEPHLLLPLMYSLNPNGVYSTYSHEFMVRGVQSLCAYLPNGVDDYMNEVRKFVFRVYAKTVRNHEKYFLDKTPAYHHIAGDIIALFPEAKFVFLWRNPLSVVSSYIETFYNGQWQIQNEEFSFFDGLEALVSAYQKYEMRSIAVRYEDIVFSPLRTWQKVFNYLELSFYPEIIENFYKVKLKEKDSGDPYARLPEYQSIRQTSVDRWKNVLVNPLRKAWCRRYLCRIGEKRLGVMGYDFQSLLSEINSQPSDFRFLLDDIFHFPYGLLCRFFEPRIMSHKLKRLRDGQRLYMHR